MTRLEQAVNARLAEIRTIAESGHGELTGKAQRLTGDVTGEEATTYGRRFGGVNLHLMYPEMKSFRDVSPGRIAKAIKSAKGKRFRQIRAAVAAELRKHVIEPRRRQERPTIAAHPAVTGKCKLCGVPHGKSEHRFHGRGAFHQTHLFSFNPPMFIVEGKTKNGDAVYYTGRAGNGFVSKNKSVAFLYQTKGAATLRVSSLNAGSPLHGIRFYVQPIQKNPQRRRPTMRAARENPRPVVIYGRCIRILAQKTQPHACDAKCTAAGHRYFHDFKPGAVIYGLSNGDLKISRKGA